MLRQARFREKEVTQSLGGTCLRRTRRTTLANDDVLLKQTAFLNTCDENFLKVIDHVGNEGELATLRTVVIRIRVIRVIEAEFRANRDDFVRPPGNAD